MDGIRLYRRSFEINYVTPDFGYLKTIEEYSYSFYQFQSEMNNVQECNFNSSEMILSATMFSYDEIIAVTETEPFAFGR
ncbi:MAG: hypothetical protein R2759_12770 [Bacteroidales bacterium]